MENMTRSLKSEIIVNASDSVPAFTTLEQAFNTKSPVEGTTHHARMRFPEAERHVRSVYDQSLGKHVFRVEVHDQFCPDGCYLHGPSDRQRIEVRPTSDLPEGVARENDITEYVWNFKIDDAFPRPTGFCHIFQMKATSQVRGIVDEASGLQVSGTEAGSAILLLSVSSTDEVTFRHNRLGGSAGAEVLEKVPVRDIKGKWVKVEITVLHSDNGCVRMKMSDVSTGRVYMKYDDPKRVIDLWRRPEIRYEEQHGDRMRRRYEETALPAHKNQYNRPKWGIYRKAIGAYDRDGVTANSRYAGVDVQGAVLYLSDITIRKFENTHI